MGHRNHGNHGNHTSYTGYGNNYTYHDPNTGQPINLNWENWPSNDVGNKISDSVSKLNELRDQINYLKNNKSGSSVAEVDGVFVPDNPALDFTGAQSADFDDADPQTPEYVDDVQYDTIKNNLETLYTHITGNSTNLPNKNEGEEVKGTDYENIKAKIDELAQTDNSGDYTNHHSHNNHGSHVSYS